jgi:hypothetical protein
MHAHTLAPVETAIAVVRDERSEIAAERDAFAALADRVADCPVQSPPMAAGHDAGPPVGVAASAASAAAPDADPHERLRRAYRETVMSVDHYDAVYGESLFENAASELGADLATALRERVPFSPAFKATLHDAVTDARAERERFLELLRTEAESLADARATLGGVVDAIPRDGEASPASLADLEQRCERVGCERQATLRSQFRAAPADDDLYDYLYGDQSWTHPVLTVVATLVADLDGMHPDDGTYIG